MLKKTITIAVLLFVPLISFAQNWIKIDEFSKESLYVDVRSIKRNKNTVQFWMLTDYKIPTSMGDKSVRSLVEVDCINSKIRFLDISFFSENMLEGEITAASRNEKNFESNWQFIPPGTINESIAGNACRK